MCILIYPAWGAASVLNKSPFFSYVFLNLKLKIFKKLISYQTRCSWNADQQSGINNETEGTLSNNYGFGSISRRQSCKPIIAAVIGGAYGGGVEMILNCDLVIASQDAKFALPEVKRGVVAVQGGKCNLFLVAHFGSLTTFLAFFLTGKFF